MANQDTGAIAAAGSRGSVRLRDHQRFLIGGLGGIAPVLVSLIVIDLDTIRLGVTFWAVLSYFIRASALFTLGGLVGLFHRKESDLFKLFELGIAAPALIAAGLNGNRINLPQPGQPQNAPVAFNALQNLVPDAYAQPQQPTPPESGIKRFEYPRETVTQQVSRGLFGTISKNVWFVVCGSYPNVTLAQNQAIDIRRRGFSADVYGPYGGGKLYAVVIGANLTQGEAQDLRQRALKAGLPPDTYLWTFPGG